AQAGLSATFTVTAVAGTGNRLAFSQQPASTTAGTAISPAVTVTILDSQGNPSTTATDSITIAIGTNPSGGTLGGPATVAAVSGVAPCRNLTIDKAGTTYTLSANGAGLNGATSTAVAITAGAAHHLAFTVQPSNTGSGAAISPAVQVTILDVNNNVVASTAA